MSAVVNFMLCTKGLTSVSCLVRDVRAGSYIIILHVYRDRGRAGRDDDLPV